MKPGVLSIGIFLLCFAAFSWAATTVSCTGTYNMGTLGGMDFNSCAINELIPGAGGSAVITHNNYYCVKVTKFYQPFSTHKINVQLLNGVSCGSWVPGNYCYNQMFLGGACNKDILPGQTQWLGNLSNYYITYGYQSYYNAYGNNLQSFPAGMLYTNDISAMGGKRGGKGIVAKQASQVPSAYASPIASAVKAVTRKPRLR